MISLIQGNRPVKMPEQLAIFKSLQHPTRQEILKFLGEHPQDIPYTDLLDFCDGSTGKLNYHLRTLDDLVNKNDTGYNISEKGKRVLSWLKSYDIPGEITDEFEKPEIIFNKIFPSKSLLHKFWLEALLISIVPLIVLLILAIIAETFYPIILWVGSVLITGFVINLYVNNIWYRITDTEVEVHKGVITKTHKIVPFRTMTNLELKQGIFDRIFDLSTVDIHTAGSGLPTSATEAIIGMVEGEEIKDTIFERIRLLNPIIDFSKSAKKKNNILTAGLVELRHELRQLNGDLQND